MDEIIRSIIVYALPVLFAVTLHEASHAYAAKYFGDSTAFVAGRMTLDPFKHIDPFGTILLPLGLYFLTKGQFVFGYAKPVPVNFAALRHPRRDSAWVALAGPMSNFAMGLGWMILALITDRTSGAEGFVYEVAIAGIKVNLLMFAFNLVPIPPLDGGRVLTSILPPRLGYKFAQIEPYGFFIVMGLVAFRMLDFWVFGLMEGGARVMGLLATPVGMVF